MEFFSEIIHFIIEHWLSALVFIGIFSVLIILHELGHFWAARKGGVRVLEFGFGLPPKVWGKKTTRLNADGKREEMEWTLNAIPFGGFVRMEGEEEKSNAPSSFGNRPLGWRILVVCGGVIMNFLLGWSLLTIGYGTGMNPLSPSDDQKEQYLQEGFLKKLSGVVVITSSPKDLQGTDLKYFDIVTHINGYAITNISDVSVFSSLESDSDHIDTIDTERMKKSPILITIERFNFKTNAFVTKELRLSDRLFVQSKIQVVVSDLEKNKTAEAIGIQKGDIITAIEFGNIQNSHQFVETLNRHFSNGKKNIRLTLERNGQEEIYIVPLDKNGKMGIGLIDTLISSPKGGDIAIEQRDIYVPVKKVQYSWIQSPEKAFDESLRWMGLSFGMVKNVFTTIISEQKIPEGVGGPVAIADTTDTLVQFGDWSKILQFTAILSLSLAVVNLMPFPGLDGGRLIFLLGELVMRIFSQLLILTKIRKNPLPNQLPEKYEMPLHAIGYILLLGLILWITWNDIARIFW